MANEERPLIDYSPEKIANQYRQRFSASEKYRNSVWKIICADFFSRYISSESTVLDVGSGWAEFINNINASKKYAMDLNEDSKEFTSREVEFIQQDCSERWPIGSGYFDVVFTSNFLEHLPDKLGIQRTVSEAFRCLKEGGLLICLGPNIKFVPGSYWDFWDHRIPLTEKSCSEVLQLNGFDIIECHSRFLPYTMSNGRHPPLPLVALYLRLPFVWPLFGKQFLVIGKKSSQSLKSGNL
jgi:SAM-dependent methyltransferase